MLKRVPGRKAASLLDRLRAMEAERAILCRRNRHVLEDLGSTPGEYPDCPSSGSPAHYETVMRMSLAADLRDQFAGAHGLRTGKLAGALARALECDEAFCARIELAAPAHDIGKIGVPDSILLKPARLSEEERGLVEMHCEVGALLLSAADSPVLQLAAEIALNHHERWDGEGYPRGLKRGAIPLSGQIVAVADVFDALFSERPYRVTMPLDVVADYIEAERGHAFSPALVDAFMPLLPRMAEACRRSGEPAP